MQVCLIPLAYAHFTVLVSLTINEMYLCFIVVILTNCVRISGTQDERYRTNPNRFFWLEQLCSVCKFMCCICNKQLTFPENFSFFPYVSRCTSPAHVQILSCFSLLSCEQFIHKLNQVISVYREKLYLSIFKLVEQKYY